MWSSTLPTGTVSTDSPGRRTYPEKPSATGGEPSCGTDRPTERELIHEVERLRRQRDALETEVEQLETQVERLQTELSNRRESEQAIIDRYEYIIHDLEQASATSPSKTRAARRADVGLLDRVRDRMRTR